MSGPGVTEGGSNGGVWEQDQDQDLLKTDPSLLDYRMTSKMRF